MTSMKQRRNNFSLLAAGLFGFGFFLFIPLARAVEVTTDLEVDSIFFSTEEFVAGDHIRIYARVENHGLEDVIAYVVFRRGPMAIGNSQLVSVRAGGLADEVFVDFEVPRDEFNIAAVVHPDSMPDTNTVNNEKLTAIFTPTIDDDRDRVADERDNCPMISNTDQENADGDASGDACDPDDDNDGLTDAQEAVAGTDSTESDSDNDGTPDAADAFPTDGSRARRVARAPELKSTLTLPATASTQDTETIIAPEKLTPETVSATASGASTSISSPRVPPASVRERTAVGTRVAADREEALPGFWSFRNPLVAWIFWILVATGVISLTLERMIGGKYKKMILDDESPRVAQKVTAAKSKRKIPKKKRPVKKLPARVPQAPAIDEPPT